MSKESPITKKVNIWLPFLLSIVMLVGMLIGGKIQPKTQETKIVFENVDTNFKNIGQGRVEELIRYIQAKYVDNIDSDELVEIAITSLFKDLDPHSIYLSADQVKKANESLEGSFVGIGIEYFLKEDTVVILSVLKDGPAAEAGLQYGDHIIDVIENETEGLDEEPNTENESIVKKLRGKNKSTAVLLVRRPGENSPLTINVNRSRITVNSVDASYMLNDNTGYIKLNKFSANTITDFMDALSDLIDNYKMTNLVFDLRQNGGGYLHEAVKILNQIFEDKDQLMVYTVGKNIKKEEFFSSGRNVFDIDKIYVLIDENSASASEIVAGAIQDWDRGLIIGRRSYGKGLVQEQYDLKDGSALRLTVARYYTPAGRLIQRDYEAKEEYDSYLEKRIESGEFTNSDQITISDTSKFYTANGRQVYAGGGITPDVYVPFDSLLFDKNYQSLSRSLTKFAFHYISNYPNYLTEDDFIDNFEFAESTLDELIAFHADLTKEDIDKSILHETLIDELMTVLKAKVGRQLFNELVFYKVINQDDPVVREAIDAQKTFKQLTQQR